MRFITPCGPTLRDKPPAGPQWAHEIKWDGWRPQAHKRADDVTLYSRLGRDLTARFPRIAEAVAAPPRRLLVPPTPIDFRPRQPTYWAVRGG